LNWRLPFLIGAGLTVVSLYFTQKIKMPLPVASHLS